MGTQKLRNPGEGKDQRAQLRKQQQCRALDHQRGRLGPLEQRLDGALPGLLVKRMGPRRPLFPHLVLRLLFKQGVEQRGFFAPPGRVPLPGRLPLPGGLPAVNQLSPLAGRLALGRRLCIPGCNGLRLGLGGNVACDVLFQCQRRGLPLLLTVLPGLGGFSDLINLLGQRDHKLLVLLFHRHAVLLNFLLFKARLNKRAHLGNLGRTPGRAAALFRLFAVPVRLARFAVLPAVRRTLLVKVQHHALFVRPRRPAFRGRIA